MARPEIHIYTAKEKRMIKKRWNTDGARVLAAELGVKTASLRLRVTEWRKRGMKIPRSHYNMPAEIGEIRERKEKGLMCQFIKTAEGWKRVRKRKEKVVKPPVEKKVDGRKNNKPGFRKILVGAGRGNKTTVHTRRQKAIKEPRKYSVKPPDLSNKIRVQIDSKTVLYVKPGTDIDALRAKIEAGRIQKKVKL